MPGQAQRAVEQTGVMGINRAALQPPMWLSVTVPVSGDLVTSARRPLMLASVPVRGPFMKQSTVCGPSASTVGPASRAYRTPRPRAPMYLRAHSSGIGAYVTFPAVRSI